MTPFLKAFICLLIFPAALIASIDPSLKLLNNALLPNESEEVENSQSVEKEEPEKTKGVSKSEKETEVKAPSFLIPFTLGSCGPITWRPGATIQVQYKYDEEAHHNSIYLPRVRLKCGGDIFNCARYYIELRADNIGAVDIEDEKVNLQFGF